jgi:hypothetical protein
MSSILRPRRFSTFGTANTGPIPISSGSQPATAKPRKRPSGCSPRCCAIVSFMTTTAPAPSLNWLALPAEMTPPGIAGRMSLMPSYVVPARMPSSCDTVTSFERIPITASATPAIVVTGMISASKRPASRAAVAFCWLAAPYSSMRWREMS